MSNIITSQIRADREYRQLCELALESFGAAADTVLPILANGLCAGAADALTVSIIEDTAEKRGAADINTPALIICHEEKECQRLCRFFSEVGIRAAFFILFFALPG